MNVRPIPRLYAIVDAAAFRDARDPVTAMSEFAADLIAGGVTLIQLRHKQGNPRQALSQARELRRVSRGKARLIMNDRADLCLAAGFDGVHVGQDDLSPEGARAVVGNARWVGVSTHTPEQVREADGTTADYIAIGPVFPTASKSNPDPVIGLEALRAARALTPKPLVAIGGITRENCRSVMEAGADAVAVISDLAREPRRAAEEFLRFLG